MRAWAALATNSILYALATAWAAIQLPAEGVPLHFNASGTADRLGSRSQALTIAVLPGLVVLGLTIGLMLLVRYGPLKMMNIPHKSYWLAEQRQTQARRMLTADLALVMSVTLVFLAQIPVWIALGARTGGAALSPLLILGPIVAYIAGLLIWSVWLVRYRYRPGPEQ
jgi:Protein of unknown function (DUF1648)